MTAVSVIIVAYNSEEYIIDCINSIKLNTSSTDYEIIVVDNNSEDNTVNYVKTAFSDIKIIENKINTGYAPAVNKAANEASGEYLFFLNPDTILKNNAIDILYSSAKKNIEAALLGGKLFDENEQFIFSGGFLPNIKNIILLLSNNKKLIKPQKINVNQPQYVELIAGADFFVRKSVFEELNGFDEDYFMYYEELDFCFRLKNKGYKAMFEPEAHIMHSGAKSQQNPYLTDSYNLRYSFLFCLKNFPYINHILLRLTFFILSFYIKNNIKNLPEFKKTIKFIFTQNK